jgi:hypothetical protein
MDELYAVEERLRREREEVRAHWLPHLGRPARVPVRTRAAAMAIPALR